MFAFLAAGTNDPTFSPRVLEIRKVRRRCLALFPGGVESVLSGAGMVTCLKQFVSLDVTERAGTAGGEARWVVPSSASCVPGCLAGVAREPTAC